MEANDANDSAPGDAPRPATSTPADAHERFMQLVTQRSLHAAIARQHSTTPINVDTALRTYFRQLDVPSSLQSSTPAHATTWPHTLAEGTPCDATLLQAGIADLSLSKGKHVLPVTLAQSLLPVAAARAAAAAASSASGESLSNDEGDHSLRTVVTALRVVLPMPRAAAQVFIPLYHERHWGCVVITFTLASPAQEAAPPAASKPSLSALLRWGDGMRRGAPPSLLHVVQSVATLAYDNVTCVVDDSTNYILDTTGFAVQGHAFASGFYVLALLSVNADSSTYLPRRPFEKYDTAHVEQLRNACAMRLLHRVYAIYIKAGDSIPVVNHKSVIESLRSGSSSNITNDSAGVSTANINSNVDGTSGGGVVGGVCDRVDGDVEMTEVLAADVEGATTATEAPSGAGESGLGDAGDTAGDNDEGDGEEKPQTTVLVHDIVRHYQQLASQGFFFGNTSHQGLKGRSGRGQLYRAYIQLRCIKYPGDRKRDIPRCKAKLRYDKLRDKEGWHASLFSEHSHPPLPEKLRSRRENQVLQTLRDVQMWYLPKNSSQRPVVHVGTPDRDNATYGEGEHMNSGSGASVQRGFVAEKILPRPPHISPDGHPLRPMLVSRIARQKVGAHGAPPHTAPLAVHPGAAPPGIHAVPGGVPVQSVQQQVATMHGLQSHGHVAVHPSQAHLAIHAGQQPHVPMHTVSPHSVQHGQGGSIATRGLIPIAPREAVRPLAPAVPTMQAVPGGVPAVGHPNGIVPQPAMGAHAPVPMENVDSLGAVPQVADTPNEVRRLANGESADGLRSNGVAVGKDDKDVRQNGEDGDEAGASALIDVDADGAVVDVDNDMDVQPVPIGEPMEQEFRARGEDLMSLKGGGASLALVAAIRAYVNTSHLKLAENEMAHHIKKIAEQCGYKLRIRRSMYHAGQENVFIKSATFECAQKVRHGCPFAFRLRGHLKRRRSDESSGDASPSEEDELPKNYGKQAVYTTSVQFLEQAHNHEHDVTMLRKHIQQPDVPKAPVQLARAGSMTVGNVIRHVEKKHSFMVPRAPLRKRIVEERETKDPLGRQCNALASRLIALKNEQPDTFVNFAPQGCQNTLSRLCWSFSEWQEDFMVHGRVPGIYIDTKELASLLKLPLVAINGRTSTGDTLTFFVAFIAEKSEESLTWMLEQFKCCMARGETHTPKVIAFEQCTGLVTALRTVFPSSWLILDEQSISHDEKENVSKFLDDLDMAHMKDEMVSRLQVLRQASTHEDLVMLRKGFESTFFSQLEDESKHPSWYKYLYYSEKELVSHCFNRSCCGLRFAFDGKGYAQTFDSVHKLSIDDATIESSEVPQELRKIIAARRSLMDSRRREANPELTDLLMSVQLYGEEHGGQSGLHFVQTHTEFCVRHFVKEVAEAATEWRVRLFKVRGDTLEGDTNVKTVNFHVCRVASPDEAEQDTTVVNGEWEVLVMRRCPPTGTDTLQSSCACGFFKIHGMPCVHQVAVIRMYNGSSEDFNVARAHLSTTYLPLSHFFHTYWKRDDTEWRDMVSKVRKESSEGERTGVGADGEALTCTNRTRATMEAGRRDWQNHLAYAANKAVFDKAWSAVEELDSEKRAMFHSMMWQLVQLCRQQMIPDAEKLRTAAGCDSADAAEGNGDAMDADGTAVEGDGQEENEGMGAGDGLQGGTGAEKRPRSGCGEPSPQRRRVEENALPGTAQAAAPTTAVSRTVVTSGLDAATATPTESGAGGATPPTRAATTTEGAGGDGTVGDAGATAAVVSGVAGSSGGSTAGGGEFGGSFVSSGMFPNDLGQLGDEAGQRPSFGSGTAGKTVFESVMRRLDG